MNLSKNRSKLVWFNFLKLLKIWFKNMISKSDLTVKIIKIKIKQQWKSEWTLKLQWTAKSNGTSNAKPLSNWDSTRFWQAWMFSFAISNLAFYPWQRRAAYWYSIHKQLVKWYSHRWLTFFLAAYRKYYSNSERWNLKLWKVKLLNVKL